MIFINNKYTTWYNLLINNAKNRKIDGYTEKHHIIPSSLGGTNDDDNLVKLTAREHFVCHLLLIKMVEGKSKKKMSYALWLMCNLKNHLQPDRYFPTSTVYENIRKIHSDLLSKMTKGKKKNYSSFLGKRHSENTKKLQSDIKKGNKNPNYKVKQKEEWNKAKSLSQKGKLKPILICEVCSKKIGGHGNYFRWHGDRCKLNNKITGDLLLLKS